MYVFSLANYSINVIIANLSISDLISYKDVQIKNNQLYYYWNFMLYSYNFTSAVATKLISTAGAVNSIYSIHVIGPYAIMTGNAGIIQG